MTNIFEDDIEWQITEAIRGNLDSLSLRSLHQMGQLLPKTLLDIPGLRHLSLEYFNTDIPAWLSSITSLESLEIEETGSVKEILPQLWKLAHLRKLKLAYVREDLTELPSSLAKLEHLEELNVDGADFTHFPDVIASLVSLQSFSYKYCDCALPEVFDALSALPELKKISFSHYDNESGDFLPESFCRLQAIEELYFNDWNYLKELPECIGELRNLRIINLSNDDYQLDYDALIKKLPDSLGNLCNLEELDVYGLQDLVQLPKNFSRLKRLKRLNTMCSGIKELPLTPEQWGNLEALSMHGPLPDLQHCINLKEFGWFKNVVGVNYINGGVPYGTDEIISLQLAPLCNLESLSISGGALDSNAFLASMTQLRRLNLYCDFENFPEGFEKLDKLEVINIWGAKSLTALPEYLGYMPSLKELHLSGCGVKYLPKSARERKGLHIYVRDCPVKWPE